MYLFIAENVFNQHGWGDLVVHSIYIGGASLHLLHIGLHIYADIHILRVSINLATLFIKAILRMKVKSQNIFGYFGFRNLMTLSRLYVVVSKPEKNNNNKGSFLYLRNLNFRAVFWYTLLRGTFRVVSKQNVFQHFLAWFENAL